MPEEEGKKEVLSRLSLLGLLSRSKPGPKERGGRIPRDAVRSLSAFQGWADAAAEANAEATPAPEGASESTPAAEAVEELPPLNCKPTELLEKTDTWSVDCVAMWLENLGFIWILTMWPDQSMAAAQLAILAKQGKLLCLTIFQPIWIMLLVCGVSVWTYRKAIPER